jgi:hypothetical protein
MESGYKKGICQIKKDINIALDVTGGDLSNKAEQIVVLNIGNSHHSLTYKEALKMFKFLKDYINDVYIYHDR